MSARHDYELLQSRILPLLGTGGSSGGTGGTGGTSEGTGGGPIASSVISDAQFNELALAIHSFQRTWNIPYGLWCEQFALAKHWREIPVVPQAMFKQYRISCFEPEQTHTVYRSSGTTGEARSNHYLINTRLYQAAVVAGWHRLGMPSNPLTLFLSALPQDQPNASLVQMFGFLEHFVGAQHCFYGLRADGSMGDEEFRAVSRMLQDAEIEGLPITIMGTALAYVHLFERCAQTHRAFRLPPGSFALETGGFKGKTQSITKTELYSKFAQWLSLGEDQIWNEYGMCELSSQFYSRGIHSVHTGGAWVRPLVIDPETNDEVEINQTGVLRIFDLANLGSSLGIQTADLAIRREHGFELIGRDPAALPRGCSRSVDEALTRVTSLAPAAPLPRLSVPKATTTQERAIALAAAASYFPFLGKITAENLLELLEVELGNAKALDGFVAYKSTFTRAVPVATILHIISRNTPAAGLQTLMRGLLLGSKNLCKIPSGGLDEIAQFVALLPEAMKSQVEISSQLPERWVQDADAIIVFGEEKTVEYFRGETLPGQILIAHGPRVSFGIIFEDPNYASIEGAARDVCLFDQQGCLSPHVFYVRESADFTAARYAKHLALAMEQAVQQISRSPLTLSESITISSLRTETSFRIANHEPVTLHASSDTAWTVISDQAPGFPRSPLNRVIFVKPLPENFAHTLEPLRAYVSTCGIWPSTPTNANYAFELGASRICTIGSMQQPLVTWHQDSMQVLAPLVRWVDWA